MLLYKYRSWPLEGENWTKQTLMDNKVYASAPESLNDPFDSKFEVFSSKFKKDINDVIYNMHVMSFILTFLSEKSTKLQKSEKDRLKKKLAKCKTSAEGFHFVKTYLSNNGYNSFELTTGKDIVGQLEKQVSNYGIYSLAERSDNILMWSHYGDQHKGLALGFEIDDSLFNISRTPFCRKVIYAEEFPKLSPDDVNMTTDFKFNGLQAEKELHFTDNELIAQKTLYTKANCWAYEDEWRIIYDSYGLKPFPGKLVKIVFGCRTSKETIRAVKSIIKNCISNKVLLFQLEMSPTAFTLSENILR
jgi:hypothetical protein